MIVLLVVNSDIKSRNNLLILITYYLYVFLNSLKNVKVSIKINKSKRNS